MDSTLVAALFVAGLVVLVALWLRFSIARTLSRREDQTALALLQNQVSATAQQTAQQMEQLRSSLQQINNQMLQSLESTRKNVGDRLDGASRVIQDVSQHLGRLDESAKRIFEVGRDMASLQDTLRAPKLRGVISELFLDELLSQILPRDHYRTQYTFRGGETVDAAIILKAGLVPVDAKFPLENFRRLSLLTDEREKAAARKGFVKDVKTHIDAIATKYIRTDEGTFDFALMYIPAENVYYEIILKGDEPAGGVSLFSYAMSRRVIPVSPNSFYAYLQTILLGLKGLRVEERARDILDNLGRLHKEFERFFEAFRLVGQHLDNSMKKYHEAEKRFGHLEGKMEQIDGVVRGLKPAELPPSSPPAD